MSVTLRRNSRQHDVDNNSIVEVMKARRKEHYVTTSFESHDVDDVSVVESVTFPLFIRVVPHEPLLYSTI